MLTSEYLCHLPIFLYSFKSSIYSHNINPLSSFNKHLLSIYFILSFMLDTGDTILNKIEIVSSLLMELSLPFLFAHRDYSLWETGIWTSRFTGGVEDAMCRSVNIAGLRLFILNIPPYRVGPWISWEFPPFPDENAHCAWTTHPNDVVYTEHVLSFWESWILVLVRQRLPMWPAPNKNFGHLVSNELRW